MQKGETIFDEGLQGVSESSAPRSAERIKKTSTSLRFLVKVSYRDTNEMNFFAPALQHFKMRPEGIIAKIDGGNHV